MDREIGSSYPAHAGLTGPVSYYTEYLDLNKVNGIYLRYLLASVSTKNRVVNLNFNVSLKPYMLRVETIDGNEYQDWQLEDYDEEDFINLCSELSLDKETISKEDFARKVLLEIAPRHYVPVPAYKFDLE
ncbi:hypothetical protein DC365_23675 [Vibrio vulnificus]|uniref:hypothetical protein n=1 Tax=Vibrio vulnificus TaxID=672 RepID=UPI000D3E347B|nr:hypothetical protein [Vibrio vulnificus]PUZ92339.1 hypothetical protein DC365_23675 [Vibrio vulnificus]HAS6031726.1 hypothetical protein [Vibrio vulnificus]HAS6116862.1 hypothetical protein [Vibrio vulnificus]HAS6126384.1 hypothetical protein [Vibrio vulnificus]HAS6131149.1 hypothetical protein [Vibrio vulnificus]